MNVGLPQLYSSTISSSTDNTSHFARLENREQKVESVKKAITYINDDISSTLKGMSPVEQIEIDDLLLYVRVLLCLNGSEVYSDKYMKMHLKIFSSFIY